MITPAERHLCYTYLLKCLELRESLARQVLQAWYGYARPETSFTFAQKFKELTDTTPPIEDDVRWATDLYAKVWWDGVRNAPDTVRNLIVCEAMSKRFALEGIAGFYFERVWRLNIDERAAVLRPYRDADGLIQGLLVYSYLHDTKPRLLSSRGLFKGAKAEVYYPERISA